MKKCKSLQKIFILVRKFLSKMIYLQLKFSLQCEWFHGIIYIDKRKGVEKIKIKKIKKSIDKYYKIVYNISVKR
jgi:hypothetical protein